MSTPENDGFNEVTKRETRVGVRMLQSFDPPPRPDPDAEQFANYELSWLKFNWRVLHQATDSQNPLLERVKFIGIVKSNLDEFFQKRVGGLKRQLDADIGSLSMDGMMPADQLEAIHEEVKKMISRVREVFFEELVPEMETQGIRFSSYEELTEKQKTKMDRYFDEQLYPILTPLVIDHAHPFPFISNKSRSFAVELRDTETGEPVFARVKIPGNRPRWLTVSRGKKGVTLLLIDDLLREKIHRLFPGARIVSAHVFRITRNADVARNEEEADDLLEMIEEELRERKFAAVVRLEAESSMTDSIRKMLMERLGVGKNDIYKVEGAIGLADAVELYKLKGFDHLRFSSWVPVVHPELRRDVAGDDIFSTIRKQDLLVHHPYHSFATSVQRFVEEAAADPSVLAIKQTLYRTSRDSPLMHALMRAAEDGKQVAVLIELKARFDEERNMEWAQRLEQAGVHVAYGIAGLKIHSKMTIVVRQEGTRLQRYAHIGTGNYHPDTAQLYEDLGLFTAREDLTADVSDLFNFLTGFAPMQSYRKLLVAPRYMRNHITGMIQFEAAQARDGKPAQIIMKMNNLEDPLIIKELYEAADAGVEIDCIVRSVCRLKTSGRPNIRVHSVIGRFLEHSRLYYFHAGGENRYFLGSADMMHRNLDARVEALTPVLQDDICRYLQLVLDSYLNCTLQRWQLQGDGNYIVNPVQGETNEDVSDSDVDGKSDSREVVTAEKIPVQELLMRYHTR